MALTEESEALLLAIGRDEPDEWDDLDWRERLAAIEAAAIRDWRTSADEALRLHAEEPLHGQRAVADWLASPEAEQLFVEKGRPYRAALDAAELHLLATDEYEHLRTAEVLRSAIAAIRSQP